MPCYLLPTARPAFIKMNNYVGLGVDAKIVLGARCTALPCPYCSIHLASGRVTTVVLPRVPVSTTPSRARRVPDVSICEIDHWRSACTPPIRRPCVHSGMRAYTLVSARGFEAAAGREMILVRSFQDFTRTASKSRTYSATASQTRCGAVNRRTLHSRSAAPCLGSAGLHGTRYVGVVCANGRQAAGEGPRRLCR